MQERKERFVLITLFINKLPQAAQVSEKAITPSNAYLEGGVGPVKKKYNSGTDRPT